MKARGVQAGDDGVIKRQFLHDSSGDEGGHQIAALVAVTLFGVGNALREMEENQR